jgi:hypothetical protein
MTNIDLPLNFATAYYNIDSSVTMSGLSLNSNSITALLYTG